LLATRSSSTPSRSTTPSTGFLVESPWPPGSRRLRRGSSSPPPGRHCFEFRHPSWFREEVYALLREHGAALVIGDHPERPFQTYELTADWTFIRFHYGSRGRDGNYSARELEEWARRIEVWRESADIYAYFNNDWMGYAVKNGLTLRELVVR